MSFIIRHAEAHDFYPLVEMATEFFEASHYATLQTDPTATPRSMQRVVRLLLEPPHILMLAEDPAGEPLGMIALFVTPHLFLSNVFSANEVAWWVTPKGREAGVGGKLLTAAEDAAKQAGVRVIQMLALSDSPAAVHEVYRKRGYQPTETAYTKVL